MIYRALSSIFINRILVNNFAESIIKDSRRKIEEANILSNHTIVILLKKVKI